MSLGHLCPGYYQVLYGRAGYLLGAMFLLKRVSTPTVDESAKSVCCLPQMEVARQVCVCVCVS
jgi:hypothetical protein